MNINDRIESNKEKKRQVYTYSSALGCVGGESRRGSEEQKGYSVRKLHGQSYKEMTSIGNSKNSNQGSTTSTPLA